MLVIIYINLLCCFALYRYRLAVIKALPNLEKLDDIPVTAVERLEAQRHGGFLPHPDEEDAYPQSTVSNITTSDI